MGFSFLICVMGLESIGCFWEFFRRIILSFCVLVLIWGGFWVGGIGLSYIYGVGFIFKEVDGVEVVLV